MNNIKRILVTPGEPRGIGQDITIQSAFNTYEAELVAVVDPTLLKERAKKLGINIQLVECDLNAKPTKHEIGVLKYLPVSYHPENSANYVIETLTVAGNCCLNKNANALVTGPVNKELINQAGISFSGHTEFFAHLAHVKDVVMLFVVDDIRLALVTTHLPLRDVPYAVTAEKIMRVGTILSAALKEKFNIPHPRILVAGLNPHAGEGGYLGREEIEIITPTLQKLNASGMNFIGPLPADTIFLPDKLKSADAILAMYHDQALPVIKHMGFDRAVNVTLGLPFIRTSVDHGTAIDLAGTGKANPSSMEHAIRLAVAMGSDPK